MTFDVSTFKNSDPIQKLPKVVNACCNCIKNKGVTHLI